MPKFKVVVQVYKTYEFDAANADEAMKLGAEEVKKTLGPEDRFNVNPPKNLDKPAKPKPQKKANG